MHEWIPVSEIPKVVEHAIAVGKKSEIETGLQWIELQHQLRSLTKLVIFRRFEVEPRKGPTILDDLKAKEIKKTSYLVRHAGALSAMTDVKLAGDQDEAHEILRTFFEQYAVSAKAGPAEYIDKLLANLHKLVWDGSLPDKHSVRIKEVGKGAIPDAGTTGSARLFVEKSTTSMRLWELADFQKDRYQALYDALEQVKRNLRKWNEK